MAFIRSFAGWRKYRKLSTDWRRIVIYSESGQDWHYFSGLIEVLNEELGRNVTYISSDPGDPGLRRRHDRYRSVCIPEGFFLTLHFNMQQAGVVVLTMMDLQNLQLKRSINPVHYVYLFHSLGSTHMVDHADSYDAYDSLFCAGPHHVAELRKRESLAGLPPRNLFEYGHPRLETLVSEARSRGQVGMDAGAPVVLVAPTWGEQSIFNVCGERLVGNLLEAGYNVIARPHHHTLRKTPGVMHDLNNCFSRHPGFEYQEQMGETESLYRSDVLVSDWSAMAIEYALGLEKPVLFVDLPRRVRNPDWQALDIEPLEVSIRHKAGDIVAPTALHEAAGKITRLIENRETFRHALRALRDQLVFNLGHSIELGAREIARLADRHHPGTQKHA